MNEAWQTGGIHIKDIGAPVKNIQPKQSSRRDCLTEQEMERVLTHLEDRMKSAQTANKIGKRNFRNSYAEKRANGQYATTLRDYAMVLLMVICGLRVSEVSSLDVGDLSTNNGTPILWVKGKGRDGKAEYVVIPLALQQWLYKYLETRERLTRNSPMFVAYASNSFNMRLSSRSISRIAKQAMIAVGLKSRRLTAHSFRHTAITLAINAGASLLQVQQFARHRLPQSTLIYIHMMAASTNPCSSLVMKLLRRLGKLGNIAQEKIPKKNNNPVLKHHIPFW